MHGFDEPDCVLVGTPARVVRRGILWSREARSGPPPTQSSIDSVRAGFDTFR